ncbi:MAG: lytic transglycosylase domain-containing protein [Pyrinomonadaceae bacterium]
MNRLQLKTWLLLICVVLVAGSSEISAKKRSKKTAHVSPAAAEETFEGTRLALTNGSFFAVDDAWENNQGVWYRQGGFQHLIPKEKVKAIQRSALRIQATEVEEGAPATQVEEQSPGVFDKPAWIYLKGGARVEADSATQSQSGVWYKRGPLAIFLEASRVDRIELEDNAAGSGTHKERGWSTGSSKLDTLIRQNGNRFGVDPYLVFLVMEQESHFNSGVVSPKGARGLMQLMPGTSARFGVRHPHDPAQNISGGTRYLRELLDRFNNKVDLVLASYNAGEGAVIKFGHKVPPYRETRNYVKRISYRYQKKTMQARPSGESERPAPGGQK